MDAARSGLLALPGLVVGTFCGREASAANGAPLGATRAAMCVATADATSAGDAPLRDDDGCIPGIAGMAGVLVGAAAMSIIMVVVEPGSGMAGVPVGAVGASIVAIVAVGAGDACGAAALIGMAARAVGAKANAGAVATDARAAKGRSLERRSLLPPRGQAFCSFSKDWRDRFEQTCTGRGEGTAR